MVDAIGSMKLSQDLVLGLSDFELIRVIGRGSYAKVLLVRLKKNEQMFAMKVVKKELVHDDEVGPSDGSFWCRAQSHRAGGGGAELPQLVSDWLRGGAEGEGWRASTHTLTDGGTRTSFLLWSGTSCIFRRVWVKGQMTKLKSNLS